MRHFILVTLFLLIGFTNNNSAQDKDTLTILFVGNSYTYFNNLHQVVEVLSDSTEIKIVADHSTYPGAHLSDHYYSYKGIKTVDKIKSGDYDAVILQDFSMQGVYAPDSIDYYVSRFAKISKECGVKLYLFETWAREIVPQYQEEITSAYSKAALNSGAEILPVGRIWKLAREINPNLEFFRTDGTHPSPLGTFLTAMTMLYKFTGELPANRVPDYFTTDYRGNNFYLMSVGELEFEFCKRIVQQFYNSNENNKP
ncbi:MAG: hypothetical protein SCALA702_19230 [Melioribacteraceae bacterium]|nr:MAG: hypothetical protein SCALA702_19230 [Melioribacteraceae bacterium]